MVEKGPCEEASVWSPRALIIEQSAGIPRYISCIQGDQELLGKSSRVKAGARGPIFFVEPSQRPFSLSCALPMHDGTSSWY